MKNKGYLFIIALIGVFMASGFLFTKCGKTPPNVIKTDTVTVTDTLWRDTTIYEKELVPKYIVKTRTDTVFNSLGDTIELVTESKMYEKSLVSDKDTCDLQIYTTGIETSLDSLKMRLRTHSVTNTVEITKYIEKKKTFWNRFHFGVQTGLGYGITQKKVDLYVGLGGSFDL